MQRTVMPGAADVPVGERTELPVRACSDAEDTVVHRRPARS
jgi:hypothetical protein